MELETVIAELQQLRADFAELKNKFESLLGQAGWQWFKYSPAQIPASATINYTTCPNCGWFYQVGSFHACPTGTLYPTGNPIPQNPVIFSTNGASQTVASGYAKDVVTNLSGN